MGNICARCFSLHEEKSLEINDDVELQPTEVEWLDEVEHAEGEWLVKDMSGYGIFINAHGDRFEG